MSGPVLEVEGLTTAFRVGRAWHPAVRDVSFTLEPNETLALVGESGCGKSVTALSILRLVTHPGRIEAGAVHHGGRDLMLLGELEMERLRGDRIAMIFQEPMTSLNPVLPIGFQVAEPLIHHRGLPRDEAGRRALDLLDEVRIPSARQRFADYPHQFSGGMRQRVMIAMALACGPDVLLADEPTTALDVTIQAQVLALLAELKRERRMAMVFITHNLGVVAAIADRVAVMYAGEVVETAPVEALFARPTHPYTEALLRSIPRPDRTIADLASIPGQVPAIDAMPAGCRFAPRCALRIARCAVDAPTLAPLEGDEGHLARCHVRAPPSPP
jgi:peptide/nickel transport system ATP-binding protein